jgi:putative ABC transport system permease protein
MLTELKLAFRHLAKRPLFALSALLLLALGFGLAGTLATIVRDVILRPFPYVNSAGFVVLRQEFPARGVRTTIHSGRDYLDLRVALADLVTGMGAFRSRPATLGLGDSPQRVNVAEATSSGLTMAGMAPLHGRFFTAEEEIPGRARVVVLSHDLWRNSFASDPAVVGSTLRLDGISHTIIGVAPPRFTLFGGSVWVPLHVPETSTAAAPRDLYLFAFLRPGVSLGQAQAQMQRHYDAVAPTLPPEASEYRGRRALIFTLTEQILGEMWVSIAALSVTVGLLLVLTVVNIGSLFFLRVANMAHEISVRVALGASGRRIVLQVVAEALLLAVAGGVLAAAIAWVAVPAFLQVTPRNFLPSEALVRVDPAILAGTLGSAVLAGLVAAIGPAWWALRHSREDALAGVARVRRGSHATRRAEWIIVATEAALAFAIVLCTTHLGLAFARRLANDSGFRVTALTTTRMLLPSEQRQNPDAIRAAIARAEDALRTLPGVESFALALHRPLAETRLRELSLPGRQEGEPGYRTSSHYRAVTPDYLATLGMRLVSGRFIAASDRADGLPVAVVNETMARAFWPGRSPLGESFELRPTGGGVGAIQRLTVIGVVRDTLQADSGRPDTLPEIFVPMVQSDSLRADPAVLVRGRGGVPVPVASVNRALQTAIGGDVSFFDATDYDGLVARLLGPQRLGATVLGVLGIASLLVTAAGLYSLLAFSLEQRKREMGIRQAIGASRRQIVGLFLGRGARLVLPGLVVGGLAFQFGFRLLGTRIAAPLGVDATAAAVSLVALAVATLIAGLLPGLRAARISPVVALRSE